MKKFAKILAMFLGGIMLTSTFACGQFEPENENPPTTEEQTSGGSQSGEGQGNGGTNNEAPPAGPQVEQFKNLTVWNEEMMKAYLKPYWSTDMIYNETVVFIGETGSAKLMYTPTEVNSVRNYFLTTTYVEGVDYEIEGNVIRRLQGSSMPYWRLEDYYLDAPNWDVVQLLANKSNIEFDLGDGDKYLPYYDNDTTFTGRQVAVTYRHNDTYSGQVPMGQSNKLKNFVTKVKNGKPVKIMYYGDSCAVDCNASGTIYGGYVSPYMPGSGGIVKYYIENKYGTYVNYENRAVGGWLLQDCIDHYYDAQENSPQRIPGKNLDLMVLRIGGNDGGTTEANYKAQLNTLINMYFTDYPNAELIIQTPDLANEEVMGTPYNVQYIDDWSKAVVEESPHKSKIAIADVQAFNEWLRTKKKSKNWLANNINHPNDFMLRAYAQHVLVTMFGEEFTEG